MWRDNQSTNRPLVINLNTQDTLIGTDDLNFDAGWGIRAGFGVRQCDRGAGNLSISACSTRARSIGGAGRRIGSPGRSRLVTNNFFFADEVSVRYSSQINNAEINRVCCCCCCDGPCSCRSVEWLYGFRYLNLHEDLSIVSTDLQEGTSTYDIHYQQQFIRRASRKPRSPKSRTMELGRHRQGRHFRKRCRAAQRPDRRFPGVRRAAWPFGEQRQRRVRRRSQPDSDLSDQQRLGHRLGYNLIWIEGVALAPDQLDFTNTPRADRASPPTAASFCTA